MYFTSETRFGFDEFGRLNKTKSPTGNSVIGQIILTVSYRLRVNPPKVGNNSHFWSGSYQVRSISTAAINSLEYSFDEFGNRRKTYLDSTSQSGINEKIESWYKYDLNDQVLIAEGMQSNGAIAVGKLNNTAKGYSLAYDAAGRRTSSERWKTTTNSTEVFERSEYSYNDLSQVLTSSISQVVRAQGATSLQAPQSRGAGVLSLSNTYDDRGRRTQQQTYSNGQVDTIEAYGYRGDNQKVFQESRKATNGVVKLSQANYFNEAGMYDAVGNSLGYRYVVYNSDGQTINYRGANTNTYVGFDTYKQGSITTSWTKPGTPTTSTYVYGVRGELQEVVANGSAILRSFASDRDGKLIARQESNGTAQNYAYYQGSELASVGNASGASLSDTFTPISENYPSPTPTSYVINQGDTLAKIASAIWGDPSMWYLIADANGLTGSDELIPGSSLQIPNVVSSTRNTANTFKPYNAEEIIGNVTLEPQPLPPPPPKPKKKKCGGVASVVMVVVAVVASVFTAGASMALLSGASLAAAGSAGLAAVTGGLAAVAASVGPAAFIGGSLIGGAVGSAASQLVGKSMGVVDKFSWKQVATGAISGVATAGLGYAASQGVFGSTIAGATNAIGNAGAAATATTRELAIGYAAQGIFGYVASYAANKIVGLSTSFSWRDMAASSLGAMIGGTAVTGRGFGSTLLRAELGAHSKAFIRDKWLGGKKPNYAQVATDAFGNALASYLMQGPDGTASAEEDASSQLAPDKLGKKEISDLTPMSEQINPREEDLPDVDIQISVELVTPGQTYDSPLSMADAFLSWAKYGINEFWNGTRQSIYDSSSPIEAGIASTVYAINGVTKTVAEGFIDTARLITNPEIRSNFIDGVEALVTTNPAVTARGVWSAWNSLSNEERLLSAGGALATLGVGGLSKLSQPALIRDTSNLISLESIYSADTVGGVISRGALEASFSGLRLESPLHGLLYGARSGEGLPGFAGVPLSGRPSVLELENLTVKHGVEFAVTYKFGIGRNGGGGQYFLHSGEAGGVAIPLEADRILISHTHPGIDGAAGARYASDADMEVLEALQKIGSPQRSSLIVPVGRDVIVRFGGGRDLSNGAGLLFSPRESAILVPR
ncbi:LysM peptidoglycan-binding domain-containing protein [Pseudomonas otitidis]|uniref:LysM peptidoglycan-binding domain-containing protein n=1 Tax=Metapseudomonas otitidis TaxID=319939 RepID=UPI0024467F43|nr:LysM peptidoglycan-binding domain-containing protein [Pseudomonas otitidis]MDH1109260.1 LysM peptidoglycan-binding domain-containing protein [Pseudomonas otitidis]MDH1160246.1 LysM peptidoglycan-binding domain-containing protein [Pseudomonas otitidis]MDH1167451.1 LysM peptidoglycan-binding domain-containing protein [Pseudomonas otitidis]